jgi:excisionase family DNA binding protein
MQGQDETRPENSPEAQRLAWENSPLNMQEAAAFMKISVVTLRALIRKGDLRTVTVGSKKRLLPKTIIEYWDNQLKAYDYTKLRAGFNGLAGAI